MLSSIAQAMVETKAQRQEEAIAHLSEKQQSLCLGQQTLQEYQAGFQSQMQDFGRSLVVMFGQLEQLLAFDHQMTLILPKHLGTMTCPPTFLSWMFHALTTLIQ